MCQPLSKYIAYTSILKGSSAISYPCNHMFLAYKKVLFIYCANFLQTEPNVNTNLTYISASIKPSQTRNSSRNVSSKKTNQPNTLHRNHFIYIYTLLLCIRHHPQTRISWVSQWIINDSGNYFEYIKYCVSFL